MRILTVFRAMAWFGVLVVFWSLNVRWGTNPNLPSGPPGQWHRAVVGASLLAMIAALCVSVSGRKGNPPSWLARGIAGACALAVLFIAYRLYSGANPLLTGAIHGVGFTWMLAGGGMVAGAVLGTLAVPPTEAARKRAAREKRRKHR